jgi:hypothetical protein|tara:strand:- start:101 stop:376 length:276 start_codon:yes stop_codon:yes gene_type:complete
MSSYWISCDDVITKERKHFEVDHSVYVYIRQLEHKLNRAELSLENEKDAGYEERKERYERVMAGHRSQFEFNDEFGDMKELQSGIALCDRR